MEILGFKCVSESSKILLKYMFLGPKLNIPDSDCHF